MSFNLLKKIKIHNLMFLAILLLGVFLRFYQLGNLPGGLQRDESTVAMNSYALFHNGTDIVGHVNPFYMTDWGDGHSNMYSWLTLVPLLFSKGVMTPFVSRFPQAFIAVITLLCVYGIGKRTLGEKFGLWAMFLLAICPWHVMMARWGLDANLAPGFMTISLYFFVRAIKNRAFLFPAAVFYAFTLYTYAISWAVVPITLLLEVVYFLLMKKLKIDKYAIGATLVLIIVSIPVGLFIMINNGYIGDIKTSFFSIVRMNGYRGEEVSGNILDNAFTNLKQAYHLFVYQDGAGEIWEIRKPWGLFYDLGRLLIGIGGVWVLISSVKAFRAKKFKWEVLLLIQVFGGAISCIVTFPQLHRINLIYIPLIFCGAYAALNLGEALEKRKERYKIVYQMFVVAVFLVYCALFWKDYTGEYRELVEAYWGVGMDECVDMAFEKCEQTGISKITVEKAAQWPKLVLYTEVDSSTYMENVVFENYPIPWSFVTRDGITIQTRIDYEDVNEESIYIIYFTDKELFEDRFDLFSITDWYVAVPKGA